MARPHKCPYCEQTRSVSKGVRRTKTMGIRIIRKCKACGRKFTPIHQQAATPVPVEPLMLPGVPVD